MRGGPDSPWEVCAEGANKMNCSFSTVLTVLTVHQLHDELYVSGGYTVSTLWELHYCSTNIYYMYAHAHADKCTPEHTINLQ